MEIGKGNTKTNLLDQLEITPFNQRFPWIGGDLQTLRDTFVSERLPKDNGERIEIPIPEMPGGYFGSGHLLAFLDRPKGSIKIRGLVLILHGLGGSSRRQGLRRMSLSLIDSGFAVLRLNLRGADPGRSLAGGTYSASSNSDVIPSIKHARKICDFLREQNLCKKDFVPLYGVGISLGGTILLNACIGNSNIDKSQKPILDGLVCISSPLDLAACSESIERPRNRIYEKWLLKRLVRQTLADPFGILDSEKNLLKAFNTKNGGMVSSIRSFDAAITAPRWGYKDVDDYYNCASPLNNLLKNESYIPKTLFIQALDDPWVPYNSAQNLIEKMQLFTEKERINVVLTSYGGHNGFHGVNGCWGDDLVSKWLVKINN